MKPRGTRGIGPAARSALSRDRPFQIVEFPSEGATLQGRLYLPAGTGGPDPAVVMAHGFSATNQGMVADAYAEVFHEAGFAVLLYDHRNIGISGGEPRQEINKCIQARGYRSALDFLATRAEVDTDRIALWGDSMSGAEVLAVGAIDPRVRAVVAQVPACGDDPPPADPDGSLFAAVKETHLHGVVRTAPDTIVGPMPVVSADQHTSPSLLTPLTAFRWFIEYGGRFGTRWENWAAVGGPATRVPLHPALCTPHLKAPLLMLVASGDEMPGANDAVARLAFDRAAGPKEFEEVGGGHLGLLHHPSRVFERASQRQRDFLTQQLRRGA